MHSKVQLNKLHDKT